MRPQVGLGSGLLEASCVILHGCAASTECDPERPLLQIFRNPAVRKLSEEEGQLGKIVLAVTFGCANRGDGWPTAETICPAVARRSVQLLGRPSQQPLPLPVTLQLN